MAIALLVIGIILCILSVIMIRKDPRFILNGFVAEFGLIFLVFALFSAFTLSKNEGMLQAATGLLIVYNLIFLFMGLLFLWDGVYVLKKEGISIAHLLPFFFGALFLLVAGVGIHDAISGISGSDVFVKIMSALSNIILFVPLAIGGFFIYTIIYARLPKPKKVDYFIILGCGIRKDGTVTPLLRWRLDCAIRYARKVEGTPKYIVSGGQGADEVISEAEAMKNYLLSKGIDEDRILVEDRSTTTRENLMFSHEVMKQDGGENGCGFICTSNYHVLRAVILARSLHLDFQGIGGHTATYYLPLAFFREYIAVIFKYKLVLLIYVLLAIIPIFFL